MLIYTWDKQLKVTRGVFFRKLKSNGPEHRKQKQGHSKYLYI